MGFSVLRRFAVPLVAVGGFWRPAAAFGAPGLELGLERCESLSPARLEHLLELELSTLGGGEADTARASVTLQCAEESVEIFAAEPGTTRRLSRLVQLDSRAPDAERVLAISAAQLVRALSWLTDEQPAVPPLPNERPAAPPPAPAPKARRTLPSTPRAAQRVEPGARVDSSAGVRARALSPPLVLLYAGVGTDFFLVRTLRLGGELTYESGTAERSRGNANVRLLGAGLRLSWLRHAGPHLLFEARARASIQHAWLTGSNPRAQSTTRSIAGFGADFGLDIGPALRLGAFSLRVAAAAGVASFGGSGLVAGDDAVTVNGAWIGSGLSGSVSF